MDEFIRKLAKTDLHVHLDGSIRINTLIELAQKDGVELPSYTNEGLNEIVFKNRYNDLLDYLQGFGYTTAVMQSAENLERIAYEFAWDNFNEGVRYFEVRFAPQLHVNKNLAIEAVMTAVNKGLLRAKDEYNQQIIDPNEPRGNYGIIACAMRSIFPGMSEFYDDFLRLHAYSDKKRIFGLASTELIQAMIHCRNNSDIPVVGLDLAGAEKGFPPIEHADAFGLAHYNFFNKTVHAGEAYGPESIFQAITALHADRIGHGYYLFSADKIVDPVIENKVDYVKCLVEYIASRRITLEVCLTSNFQTNSELADLSKHSLRKMLDNMLSVTLCTDNRTVSKTTICNEYKIAQQTLGLTQAELYEIAIYGFKRCFFPGKYSDKRDYVRSVIDYNEKLLAKNNVTQAKD